MSERGERLSVDMRRPVLFGMSCVVLCISLVFGGAPNELGLRFDLIVVCAAILLGIALWSGGLSAFVKLPFWFRLWLVLLLALPLLQLIPLPPAIWQSFPGRGIATGIISLVGAGDEYKPVSLDPLATLVAWLSIVPSFAVFLAAITLGERERRYLVELLIGIALLAVAIGLFQFGSRGTIFNFYDSSHRQFLLGFFANRNHQALFLGMVAVWIAYRLETSSIDRRRMMLILFFAIMLLFGAALATFSRAGLTLFGVIAVFLGYRHLSRRRFRPAVSLALAGGAILVLAALLLSNDVASKMLERYDAVGQDDRWSFWKISWLMLGENFPVGTGLGTFVPLFAANEPLAMVNTKFVNHAHNDYLELVLETGLLGVILLAYSLILFVHAAIRLNPLSRREPMGLLLAIPVVAALHSVVDYPLRTIAIDCTVALAIAEIVVHWRVSGRSISN